MLQYITQELNELAVTLASPAVGRSDLRHPGGRGVLQQARWDAAAWWLLLQTLQKVTTDLNLTESGSPAPPIAMGMGFSVCDVRGSGDPDFLSMIGLPVFLSR